MDYLANIFQQILIFNYNGLAALGIESYGLAIIVMTIIIKVILYPLTKKQIESSAAMMELQPKMKAVQEKYKNNKEVLNQKMGELYQTHGVNPLAGCLPLIVQMPIMIGIFYGIRDFQYVGPSAFLWMQSLSLADPLHILPVLSALSTMVQSKQTMPDTGTMQSKVMLYAMPIFIGYISWTFPAGVVIYWIVMNSVQIGQQYLMSKNK